MTNNTGAIVILGGMGPQASARMLEVLVDMAANEFGAKDGADFPEIILFSLPVPDFISDKRRISMARRMLEEKIKLLNNMDASCAVLACNTAHIMLDDLQKFSSVSFISMIEAVVDKVRAQGLESVGILATPSMIKFGLFQSALERRNIKPVVPDKKELVDLEKIIRRVIAGCSTPRDSNSLVSIATSLIKCDAQGIILGCTELPLVFPNNFSSPVFDSIIITSRVLLERYFDSQRKGFTMN